MRRYLIFAAVCPLIGGFLLLIVQSATSGYLDEFADFPKLAGVFGKTLQYTYVFGIIPALMIAAIDEILAHFNKIAPVLRMLICGAIAFGLAAYVYGGRGADAGVKQYVLYGLVGLVPAMLCSWVSHRLYAGKLVEV